MLFYVAWRWRDRYFRKLLFREFLHMNGIVDLLREYPGFCISALISAVLVLAFWA